jgi:hypothetical protein
MLDTFTIKRIEKILSQYADHKIPKHIRNEMRIIFKFKGNNVTLLMKLTTDYSGDKLIVKDV